MQYYERFIKVLVDRLMAAKLLTQAELDSGRADPASPRFTPRVTPAMIAEQLAQRRSLRRDDVRIRPQFKVGQRVRARNINPVGHTRLPRYLRGHRGTIVADHGGLRLSGHRRRGLHAARPAPARIRSGSPHASCGAKRPTHETRSTPNCGRTISSESERFKDDASSEALSRAVVNPWSRSPLIITGKPGSLSRSSPSRQGLPGRTSSPFDRSPFDRRRRLKKSGALSLPDN